VTPAGGAPRKATAVAPANIALIKYWGARDLERALPLNPSLSMTLSSCRSRTTVEARPGSGDDEVLVVEGGVASGGAAIDPAGTRRPRPASADFAARVRHHLDELRRWAGEDAGETSFRVATANSFPAAAGLASSASGFAALTLATVAALGRRPSPQELSSLARRSGSGSAARSVLGGYVEWPAPPGALAGDDPDDPRAAVVAPAEHWDLRDLIALVETGPKEVSSLAGHRRAPTSPHFARRLAELPGRLETVRRALLARDFATLATAVEEEAVDLHLIAMSSRPPIFYWKPATLAVMEAVRDLRAHEVPACVTMDAGANVHVLCPADAAPVVAARLAATRGVVSVIHDRVGAGPSLSDDHLF
jgi:diphosphomevalonate decarboxylase